MTLTLVGRPHKTGNVTPFFKGDPAAQTLRFSDSLHVARAFVRIPDGSEKNSSPAVIYSYDLSHRRRGDHAHARLARPAQERADR